MNPVCQIVLICQQDFLRNLFLAKMFKAHANSLDHSSYYISIHDVSEDQLIQRIGNLSMEQQSNWVLQIKDFKFSFSCDLNKSLSQNQLMILLLQINDDISDKMYDYLQKYSTENSNLLVVINKLTNNIQKKTIKGYIHRITDTFINCNKKMINQDFIVEICLKENSGITEGPMMEKIIFMVKDMQQSHKLKNQKKISIIPKIQNSSDNSNFFIDIKTAAAKALRLIIQLPIFKIKQPTICLQELLNKNKDDAITYVTIKNQRQNFEKQISQCVEYQIFLNEIFQEQPKEGYTIIQLKKRAEQSINRIFKNYSIKDIDMCFEDIFAHDFEEAVKQTKEIYRFSFKTQLQKCQQLSEYFEYIMPIDAIDPYVQLKNNAQNAARNLLEDYVVEVQKCLKQLLKGKKDQVLSHVPRRKKQLFLKNYHNCEPLHKFLNVMKAPIQTNFQQSEKRGEDEQQQKKSNEFNKKYYQKKAISKITVILRKFGINKIDVFQDDFLEGNFQAPIKQISKSKHSQYQREIQLCKELQNYRTIITAEIAIRDLLKNYQIQRSEQCLNRLMELKLGDASKLLKQDLFKIFNSQILKCKQYQNYIHSLDIISSDSILKLMKKAMQSLETILEQYNVNVKERAEVISNILQKNIQLALFCVKKNEKNAFQKDIYSCQKLQLFWKQFLPVNDKQKLKKIAETALTMILEKYHLPQIHQLLQNILNNQVQKGLKQVHPRKHAQLKKDIQQCKELQNYLHFYPAQEEISLEESAKRLIQKICRKFNVKIENENSCVRQIMEENIQQASFYVRKIDRQPFQKAINQCNKYTQFLKYKMQKKSQNMQKQAQIALVIVLKRYKVSNLEECLKEIFAGDYQNAQKNVKRNDRQNFIKQIQLCLQYQRYKSLTQPQQKQQDKNIMIKRKAEESLRQILPKYVCEVEQCIEFIFNNQIEKVYSEVKSDKKKKFDQQLENSEQFKLYKTSTKMNVKLQKIIQNILIKKNINSSFHHQIIEHIIEGAFTQLYKIISQQQYCSIVLDLAQNDFVKFVNSSPHRERFIGKMSFFYYFNASSSQLDKIINLIVKPGNEYVQKIEDNIWLRKYLKSDTKDKLQMIENQLKQLGYIYKITKNDKSYEFYRMCQQILKILLIYLQKTVSSSINQFLQLFKITISQAQQKIKELQTKNLKIKNISLRDQCERQLQRYRQIIQLNQFRNIILSKLNSKDMNQLVINYSRELIDEDMSWNKVQIILQKKKETVQTIFRSNNFIQYIKQKTNELKFEKYNYFYLLNGQIINSLMTPISFQQTIAVIFIDQETVANFIFQQISKILKIGIEFFFIQLVYKQKKVFLRNNNTICRKPERILVYKKTIVMLQFKKRIDKIEISKNLSNQSLKTVIVDFFKIQNIYLQQKNMCLFCVFTQFPNLVEIEEQILHLEIKNNGTLKYILLKKKIQLNVYYQVQLLSFILLVYCIQDKNISL